jgi:hypothetical protein
MPREGPSLTTFRPARRHLAEVAAAHHAPRLAEVRWRERWTRCRAGSPDRSNCRDKCRYQMTWRDNAEIRLSPPADGGKVGGAGRVTAVMATGTHRPLHHLLTADMSAPTPSTSRRVERGKKACMPVSARPCGAEAVPLPQVQVRRRAAGPLPKLRGGRDRLLLADRGRAVVGGAEGARARAPPREHGGAGAGPAREQGGAGTERGRALGGRGVGGRGRDAVARGPAGQPPRHAVRPRTVHPRHVVAAADRRVLAVQLLAVQPRPTRRGGARARSQDHLVAAARADGNRAGPEAPLAQGARGAVARGAPVPVARVRRVRRRREPRAAHHGAPPRGVRRALRLSVSGAAPAAGERVPVPRHRGRRVPVLHEPRDREGRAAERVGKRVLRARQGHAGRHAGRAEPRDGARAGVDGARGLRERYVLAPRS